MLVEARQLRVRYDDTEVLHGIDLDVREGEFVSIVGRSGCSQSTLLLALAGFIASQGRVRFPREFGVVFQHYAVFPWMTVRDNISFGLQHMPAAQRGAVVDEHLALVGLSSHAAHYPSQLSGGQAQRVALARALAPDPKVILLDEPFGALDTFTRSVMQQWLSDLWLRARRTVLFVSHNIEEAIFLSDRTILMDEGQITGSIAIDFERPRPSALAYSAEFVALRREIVERVGQSPAT